MPGKKAKGKGAPSGASVGDEVDAFVAWIGSKTPRARLKRLAALGGAIGANAEALLTRSEEARSSPLLLREYFIAISELETMAARQKIARGESQRALASDSAAKERAAEAAAHKALARRLAAQVSPLTTRQGKAATARAVIKAAAEMRPETPASCRLARLGEKQVLNLVFSD